MSRSAATTMRLARAVRSSRAAPASQMLRTLTPSATSASASPLSPSFTHGARRFKSSATVMSDPMTGESIRLPDVDASLVKITKTENPKPKPASSKLVFGHTFTDHMIQVPWNSTSGWGTPEIKPYGPLQLDPSATVLHYAFTCFEGTKAYKAEDGSIRLFRLDKNMARMNRSAQRIALPTFDGDELIKLIKELVVIDSDWIPREKGYSLYLRPTLIGTQNALGVAPSNSAMLFVIACPVGPYYASGFKPVQLQATTKYKRAWPGGTGGYKLGSNYATGVTPQKEAAKEGYSQNLWLLGEEDMLTEVGTMNLFVAFKHADGTTELVTPPLEDLVLPGVIRDSVLSTARDHADGKTRIPGLPDKLKVSERKLVMADLVKAEKEGTLAEVFGSGTAVVISPVDAIGYKGRDIKIPCGNGDIGPIAKAMLDRIVGIQTGEIEHEWSTVCNPK